MQPETISKPINKQFIDSEIYGDRMLAPRNIALSFIIKNTMAGTKKSRLQLEKLLAVVIGHNISMTNNQ